MKNLFLYACLLFTLTGTVAAQKKSSPKPVVAETKIAAPVTPLKADGTPDKRFKVNKKLKKDGTPDKRFSGNKPKKD